MAGLRRLFAMVLVGLVLGVSSAAAQGGAGDLKSTVGSVRQQIRASWTAETMFRLRNAGGTVPWTGLSFVSVHASASAGDVQMKLVPGQVDLGHFTPRPGTGDNVVGLFTVPDVPFPNVALGYDILASPGSTWPMGSNISTVCTRLFQARESDYSAGTIAGAAIAIGAARVGFTWPTLTAPFRQDFENVLEAEIRSRIQLFTSDPAGHATYAQHPVLLRDAVDAALSAPELNVPAYSTDLASYHSVWDPLKLSPKWEEFTLRLDEDYDALPSTIVSASLWPLPARCDDIAVVTAVDPNDKTGPTGVGIGRLIDGEGSIPYTIVFENVPTATAPVQAVRVTDALDVTSYDLTTFQLERFTFGDIVVEAPPGLRSYSTQVDLRPAKNLLVAIDAGLDLGTGLLTCTFTSLDPATGAPPTDPLVGFLPPDVNHPEGEGTVSFGVGVLDEVPSGVPVENQARIVFDAHPYIDTGVWANTLDRDPPTSQVLPLSASQDSASFTVSWSGTDPESGVESYTVFYSEGGGPYHAWLEQTLATAGLFPGAANHNYSFYSVARNNVGWVEAAPVTPDATTGVGGATGVVPPPFLSAWGVLGSGNGQFDQPEALALDGRGALYVADLAQDRIQKFTTSGTYLLQWGSAGSGLGKFDSPSGLAVDASGTVYVTDYLNHRVQTFTDAGAFIATWGGAGAFDGQFDRPDGVAVSTSGRVYVVDSYNHRIQYFSSSGVFLGKWGTHGSGPGQMQNPAGVAIDSHGDVYVSDANNHRIEKFTSNGAFIKSWGTQGSAPGQFDTPQGIGTDPSDNVYVADFFNHRIQEFTPDGVFVTQWGTHGAGNGEFDTPADVAVDGLFRVFVADLGNHRVQKFGRGTLTDRAPFTPATFAFSVSPNPARTARLSFDLPKDTNVELAVFDLQGRQVATVFEGWLPAGRHTRQWSGATSSGGAAGSGVYFYRIRAGDLIQAVRGVRIQ